VDRLADKDQGSGWAQRVQAAQTADEQSLRSSVEGSELVIAAGAAGVRLLGQDVWSSTPGLKVLIDLNAVPPEGIEGLQVTDKAENRQGCIAYGAIGVGQTKMQIHLAAIAALFESNDKVFDAEAIYQLGKQLEATSNA
jgi:hypothetical protein